MMGRERETERRGGRERFSVNFSRALLSLLDFLNFEKGADKLFQNAGNELPLCAA